jgi:hypothetical protein
LLLLREQFIVLNGMVCVPSHAAAIAAALLWVSVV